MKKTTRKVIALSVAAGFALTAVVGCDSPAQGEVSHTESVAAEPMAEETAPREGAHQEMQVQQEAPPQQPQGQVAQQQHPQMGQPAAAGEVTSEQLDEFAEAHKEVEKIQGEVQARLQGITTPEEAQEVQQEVIAQIQERVESTGMDFHDYMMLAQRMEQDVALQQRLMTRMQ